MKCHNQAHAPPRNIFAASRPTRMVISGQGHPIRGGLNIRHVVGRVRVLSSPFFTA